jgi:hypothetical protein
MFHPGQHVLCVADVSEIATRYPTVSLPRDGTVYTVRDVLMGAVIDGGTGEEFEGLYLDEIRNDPIPGDVYEPGFAAIGFRPLSPAALDVFRLVAAPRAREVA